MWKIRFTAITILVLTALVAWSVYQSSWLKPFSLGLDLKGGSHLVYEADISSLPKGEVSEAMDALKEVIERRVNVFGVAEPVIQVERGDLVTGRVERLIVELPGVTDLKQAQSVIQATPLLEFKTERPAGPEREALVASWEEVREKIAAGQPVPPALLSLPDPYFVPSPLNGRHLERAQVTFNPGALSPSIALEFTAEGAKLFAEITKANVDKAVAIYLDGQPLSTPTVREEIRDGRAEISGDFTLEEARGLTRNLNLGALPVPIKLVSTQSIGATLGGDALNKGVRAGLVGLLAVAIFMVLWYRLPGLISMVAMAVYIILVLFIFRLVGVTITAAGLAGLILSFGLSLDANILIFERLKEELVAGRHLHEAVRQGFARAWFSIRDSNLASLISALVLFWFGTSLIRGFALTLSVGIIVSMFTAISVTRAILLSVAPVRAGRVAKFLFKCGLS